jgi:hypothetical protein
LSSQIRIEYDDDQLNVVEKINPAKKIGSGTIKVMLSNTGTSAGYIGADAYTMGSKTIGSVLIGKMKIAGD